MVKRIPVDTGCKLNVHKTFRRRPERLLYVQFTSCVYGDNIYIEHSTHFFEALFEDSSLFKTLQKDVKKMLNIFVAAGFGTNW